MSRDSFLTRVCQAAEMGRAYRVHLEQVPEDIGYVGVEGDLVQRFAAEVDEVGGQSYIAHDAASACAALSRLVEEAGAKSALCWQHELLERIGLPAFLRERGIVQHDYASLVALDAGQQRQTTLACDMGITSCDLAIAETGTLMVCSRPGQERVASLLPPYYVTIVERRQIVPDLIDAFAQLQKSEVGDQRSDVPSNVTFITGPSKTGDIELQLTTGVHGPGRWRVIVIQ